MENSVARSLQANWTNSWIHCLIWDVMEPLQKVYLFMMWHQSRIISVALKPPQQNVVDSPLS